MRISYDLSRKMLLASALTVILSAAASAAPSCEPDKAAAKYPTLAGTTVKVGQDGESPPFSQRDPADFSKLIGLDADMARAVFACAGVKMEFETGSWSGLIPATINGQMDVMWDTLLYTPERAKQLDFVAYMNSATGMLVTKGNPKAITSLETLCGHTASAGLGTTQETMLKKASEACVAAGSKEVEIITTADIPAGVRLVQSSRADLFATNKFLVDNLAATTPDVSKAFDVRTDARLAAGITKNKPELVKLVADSLAALKANGDLKAIYDKYHVDYALVIQPEALTK